MERMELEHLQRTLQIRSQILQQPMEKGDLSIFVFKNKKLSNVNIEEY
jgi:hypothetical protein